MLTAGTGTALAEGGMEMASTLVGEFWPLFAVIVGALLAGWLWSLFQG